MLISFHQTLRDWLQKSPSPQMTESEESLSGQTPCKKSCNTFLVLVFTPGCIKMFSLIQMFWFFFAFQVWGERDHWASDSCGLQEQRDVWKCLASLFCTKPRSSAGAGLQCEWNGETLICARIQAQQTHFDPSESRPGILIEAGYSCFNFFGSELWLYVKMNGVMVTFPVSRLQNRVFSLFWKRKIPYQGQQGFLCWQNIFRKWRFISI